MNPDRKESGRGGGPEEPKEQILRGLPASAGMAIGPAYLYEREEVFVAERTLDEAEIAWELTLLKDAFTRANHELENITEYARERLDQEAAAIFESQIMLLNDPELFRAIERRIRLEKKNADFLIHQELERYKALLITTNDPLFRDRIPDLDEVAQRLLRCLQRKRLRSSVEGKHIIVANQLSPADTILFSRNDVLGYATDLGGVTSHAAILARSLKIPAVVALHEATASIRTGDPLIIDGHRGLLIIHPTPERVREYEKKIERTRALEAKMDGLVHLPGATPDGRTVDIDANAEFVDECEYILAQGAGGIGLYRTEHLYLLEGGFPSEQEQYIAYSTIASMMYPRKVIIRTFDIGGEKLTDRQYEEENPSLGWRGIRVLLDKPEVFRQQLRAILRASAAKNVKLMFPMISGLAELRRALAHLEDVRRELRDSGVLFDQHMEVGIMIEVPSSVFLADLFAREVDFFSIGTNDLVQYLLAVDRTNDLIVELYQEFHPAVLRAVKHVIDTAHAAGIRVGMCGEMAGNPMAVALLLGMGLDEYSMIPSVIPIVKGIIRRTPFTEAKALADEALSKTTSAEVRELVASFFASRYTDLWQPTNSGHVPPSE
ncbi:MAG: phosphoenolpyruvate--protein phosphotransferase [Bacteroidota bacterium]|nr:phosphoenolpyruvate--protein phosphotransferase [Bacteroidota bacterium]